MSTYLVSGSFWAQAVERAVKTFAQSAIALLTGQGLGLLDVDWKHVASVAGLAALVSVLTSVGSGPFSQNGTPNLVRTRTAVPAAAAKPAAEKVVPQPAKAAEPEPAKAAEPEPAKPESKPAATIKAAPK